ncbi:Spy/CpxP family protein refolding chaperone [Kingella kingae]|uniref:Spy/CpxP family protein refolding chaperone n=1 Tax=Kingella kingae TaxID=504 RepID=UPI00041BEFA1|nr:Spy/CpxP family protein refolding chaperone [Kingella kingae]MDK4525379.1 Spy/CpxP family protein refolding chaperone [Kingella kingae]MDK4531396.1 Spy/CpxP family protein refolding chaperone [Kingella kingae]
MILFTFRFCTVVCAAGMLVAHVPAEAFSIRPNCDLRTLKLSVPQRVQLQLLRQHYKAESDRIVREIRNNRCGIELSGLFEKGMFDPTHARRVAYERYADEMAQTVEELRFYHDMYQILTPEQQKMWLNLCIKH